MTTCNLDTIRNIRDDIVKTFDDTMESKTNLIKWVNQRFNDSKKESFLATEKTYSRAVRDTSRLINKYDELYQSTDTLYTNQRKMEFQLESYNRLRSWRWVFFIPYYAVLGLVIYSGEIHYVVWLIYASLPFWVDWFVERAKRLVHTASSFV